MRCDRHTLIYDKLVPTAVGLLCSHVGPYTARLPACILHVLLLMMPPAANTNGVSSYRKLNCGVYASFEFWHRSQGIFSTSDFQCSPCWIQDVHTMYLLHRRRSNEILPPSSSSSILRSITGLLLKSFLDNRLFPAAWHYAVTPEQNRGLLRSRGLICIAEH